MPRSLLRRAVRDGDISRLTRGVYELPAPLGQAQERWELVRADHLRRLCEAQLRFPTAVASHTSAALLHGLELVVSPRAEVDLTVVDAVPRSRRYDGVTIHHTDSTHTDWLTVDGIRTTPIPRTVADVLRSRRPPHGVAMLDRAVSAGVVTLDEVDRELSNQRRWRGRPRARECLRLADPRRESWLESYSFVALHEIGMPLPLPQVDVLDERMSFVGRVDGLLPQGVFLEADGVGKYFLDADPDQAMSDTVRHALHTEQIRHDRLQELGMVGVRWTAHEVMREPGEVVVKVNTALRKARGRRFRGWVRFDGHVSRLRDLVRRQP